MKSKSPRQGPFTTRPQEDDTCPETSRTVAEQNFESDTFWTASGQSPPAGTVGE
jgi:hypothetical protein